MAFKEYNPSSKTFSSFTQTQSLSDKLMNNLVTPKLLGSETLGNVAVGLGKGVLSTAKNLGTLGQEVAQQTAGRAVEAITGVPKEELGTPLYEKGTPESQKANEFLAPETTGQSVGFGLEKIAEFFSPAGVVSKAKAAITATHAPYLLRLLGNVVAETAGTTAVGVAQGQSAEELKGIAGVTAGFEAVPGIIGAVAKSPVGQPIVKYLSEKIPSKLVNSIIKPDNKAFDFGRNPGLAVAEEGIIANTRGGLLTKIGEQKSIVGKEIEQAISAPEIAAKQIDATKAILEPLKSAKQKALQSGETGLYNRLNDLESGFTRLFIEGQGGAEVAGTKLLTGLNPKQIQELKINVGQSTRWTGQAFDNDVNQVRVAIYRNLDNMLDESVPGIAQLNSRYANLLTAEKNLERTDKNMQRLVISGLRTTGLGGVGFGASIVGGDPLSEAALKGVATGVGFEALGSPAVKTRLATQFAKLGNDTQSSILKALPFLRNILLGSAEATNE